MYEYPGNSLDRGRRLIGLLGSFWSTFYEGRELVGALCEATAEVYQQQWLDLMESVRAFSRYEVPIFHTENWYLHVLRQSEKVPGLKAWEAPPRFGSAPALMNRLAEPSVVLTHGTDYYTQDGYIDFTVDPFTDERWGTRPVFGPDGTQIDTELFVWVFRGAFDWEQVYEHWGYVLGLRLTSSEAYRDLLNALFDATTGGTAAAQVQFAYAAMLGLPLAIGNETVEQIVEDGAGRAVVTNRSVYRLPAGAEPSVAVGDALTAGQSLTLDLQFAELNNGVVPSWVRALAVGRQYLLGAFGSDLVFANESLPTEVTVGSDGFTRIEFPIGGFPLDVDEFWDLTHARGIAYGATLAELLDTRTIKLDQPGPSNLPALINPVAFLCENVLRTNAVLVLVRMRAAAPGAIGLHPARFVSKIVPPGTTVFVLIEVSPRTTSIKLDEAAGADAPGGRHEIGAFHGANPVRTTLDTGAVPWRIGAWPVPASCR